MDGGHGIAIWHLGVRALDDSLLGDHVRRGREEIKESEAVDFEASVGIQEADANVGSRTHSGVSGSFPKADWLETMAHGAARIPEDRTHSHNVVASQDAADRPSRSEIWY